MLLLAFDSSRVECGRSKHDRTTKSRAAVGSGLENGPFASTDPTSPSRLSSQAL